MDNQNQEGFEIWAKSHGSISLTLVGLHGKTQEGLYPATYWKDETEIAWRAWANKPMPDTEALKSRIAELSEECIRLDAGWHKANLDILEAQIAAQAGQAPYGWMLRIERTSLWAMELGADNPWKEKSGAIPLYTAPANELAIVQAALEAAANVIDSQHVTYNADAIRAINPQTIIDAARGQ